MPQRLLSQGSTLVTIVNTDNSLVDLECVCCLALRKIKCTH